MNASYEHPSIIAQPTDEALAQEIAQSCNLGLLASRILVARGISSLQQAQSFLTPSLDRDWRDPLDIPGMSAVADAVQSAIQAGKRILVFGDFDMDLQG